ncbi:iron uptake system protein EfeO [Peribacillus loiseleuriae]|uniref:iron uptake system protein EfeO n=1 Tax=Peribacillus loiseleuriae TaxID=1679170 RepID=UPI003CFCD71F
MRMFGLSSVLLISMSLLFGCSANEQSPKKEIKSKETAAPAADLEDVTKAYRDFAIGEISQFVKATEEFTDAVKSGDIEKAKELYPTARMYYERSEPIAEVFGDLDPKIDAREGDVPEEEWTGYHRIEKGLWEENTTKGYEEYADQLLKDTKLLRAKVETVEVTPDVLITGAVDLLNEVSTSKVTGEEDRYSHTDLYDFAANVQGAEKIYELLQPALEKKDQALSEKIGEHFNQVNQLLEKHKKDDKYILYTELQDSEIKELSQAIDALAEPLSQLGIVMEG